MGLRQKYLRDETGNVATIFVFMLGLIFMGIGAALDLSNMTSNKSKAADIADGMALAAARAAQSGKTRAQRIELGMDAADAIFEANRGVLQGVTLEPIIDIDDVTKNVTVTMKADVNFILMDLFGNKSSTVTSDAVVSYKIDSIPPISMAFAFDTSISMGYDAPGDLSKTRLEILQEATQLLFDAMESEADDPALLKKSFSTTFSSFNHDIVDQEEWSLGEQSIDNIIDYVNQMVPVGSTNSTPSLQYALEQMTANRPVQDDDWRGYVLFMTDGNNRDTGDLSAAEVNEESLAVCETLKNDGNITVITVGFGLNGAAKDFLEECSTPGNFYESDNAKEIKRHFAAIGREIGEVNFRLKY